MKLYLLALLLISCLQEVEPTSQELHHTKEKGYLILPSGTDGAAVEAGKGEKILYEANNFSMSLSDRKGFGNAVKLKADTALHDSSPLKIEKIEFDYKDKELHHTCALKDKLLQKKIRFSSSDCSSVKEYKYVKYTLKHEGNTITVAAKIEMKDNKPTHLYLRHLDGDKAIESFEYSMKMDEKQNNDKTVTGYQGKSGDETYNLSYDNKKKKYNLTLGSGQETYTTSKQDAIKKTDYDNYKVAKSTKEESDYFKTNCIDTAKLTEQDTPTSPTLYGKRHKVSGKNVLKLSGEGKCEHNIYGLNDPAVVKYLQSCQAKCISDTQHANDPEVSTNEVFALRFTRKIFFHCADDTIQLYLGKGHLSNRLYAVAHSSTNKEKNALWYDCKAGKYGYAYLPPAPRKSDKIRESGESTPSQRPMIEELQDTESHQQN